MKELSKKRLSLSQDLYDNFVISMSKIINPILTNIHEEIGKSIYSNQMLRNRSYKLLLRILILLLATRSPSTNLAIEIKELVLSFLYKSRDLFQLMHAIEQKTVKTSKEIHKLIKKICIVLSFEFSSLIVATPMIFAEGLESFAEFWKQIFLISWKSIDIQKSTSILFYRFMKCYVYYTSPELLREKGLNDRLRAENEKQEIAHLSYLKIFSEPSIIQQMMLQTIQKLIYSNVRLASNEDEQSDSMDTAIGSSDEVEQNEMNREVEIFIEEQEMGGLEFANNEMECTKSRIGAAVFEQILTRFPNVALPIYYQMIQETLKTGSDLTDEFKDTVLSQMGHLPKIYDFSNISSDNRIDFNIVLSWLWSQGENKLIFRRRSLIILKMLVQQQSIMERTKLVDQLIEMLNIHDDVVRFECLDCISILVKGDSDGDLNYSRLLRFVTPAFSTLVSRLHNPALLWKAGSYFVHILEKAQYNLDPEVIQILGTLNLKQIIDRNSEIIKPVFGDIFRYLIIGSQDKSHNSIFNLAMSYIQICFDTLKVEDQTSVFQFVGLFLRTLSNDASNSVYFQEILNRVLRISNSVIQMGEEDTISSLLSIFEEFILLKIDPSIFHIPSILIELFNKIRNKDNSIPLETVYNIGTSVLSVFTTCLLIDLDSNSFNVNKYTVD